jgi:hypothetical protein
MKPNIPSFSAGQYVRFNTDRGQPLYAGWRRMNASETQQWYEQHRKDVQEGKALPYDSAGESVLSPTDVYVAVHHDRVYEIVRARVSAPQGYGKRAGCCLVRCLLTGEEFYMQRRNLVAA